MSTTGDLDHTVDNLDADPVLAAARAGDGAAFQALLAPHVRALHVHCYRMLGSYTDAEEAVQEATVRAWRGLAGYQGAGPLRHWLYRIATTTCLKMINRRGRDPLASTAEVAWLQPYPDTLLDQLTDADADPDAYLHLSSQVAGQQLSILQPCKARIRGVLLPTTSGRPKEKPPRCRRSGSSAKPGTTDVHRSGHRGVPILGNRWPEGSSFSY